jgi:hypothetical protein
MAMNIYAGIVMIKIQKSERMCHLLSLKENASYLHTSASCGKFKISFKIEKAGVATKHGMGHNVHIRIFMYILHISFLYAEQQQVIHTIHNK